MWKLNSVFLGVLLNCSAFAANNNDDMPVKAVGVVSYIWKAGDKVEQLREELAASVSDVPGADEFLNNEQWISLVTSSGFTYVRTKAAKLPRGEKVKHGDIVEVRLSELKTAKTYDELSSVTKVLCRAFNEIYDTCATENPPGEWGRNGQPIELPKK